MPSLVAREAFLLALAMPFVRKIASAFPRSPPLSARARLQSIMPALVLSRSCLTSWGLISIGVERWAFDVECGALGVPKRKRQPSRLAHEFALRCSPKRWHRPAFAESLEWPESRHRFPQLDNRPFRDRSWYRQSRQLEFRA